MKKFKFPFHKFKSLKALPMVMVAIGSLFIIIFLPMWLWFVLIGALLIAIGLSI
ncbi:MAG: hypothetical protein RR840_08485 [Clostridium sp.]